jgi:predicted nucleic acid-binding protein
MVERQRQNKRSRSRSPAALRSQFASAKMLADTNVLLYAYDRSAPLKQVQAVAVLDRLLRGGLAVLSAQVLAEFFATAVRKLDPPLTAQEAYERLQNYLLSCEVLDLTGAVVLEAGRGVQAYQMSYWDAQIWASRLNQIPIVLSEDFSAGAVLEGVRFINPFAEDFDLDAWLPV